MQRLQLVLWTLLLGCGARTGLPVPDGGVVELADSGFADIGLPDAPLPAPSADFDVPYQKPATPKNAIIAAKTNIAQVDVAIVVDNTGSMAGSIVNLRTNFESTIIPGIAATIPSVGVAVVAHKDYPVDTAGMPGDFPVRVLQTVTRDIGLANAAFDKMEASGGTDSPESQIPAMWHVLTGGELRWTSGVRWPAGEVAKHTPAPGTIGGVDFLPGSLRVVVLVTDTSWHDCDYTSSVVSPPCFPALSEAFQANNARFVDLTISPTGTEEQANRLSDETGSSIPPRAFGDRCGGGCCTGLSGAARPAEAPGGRCRLNFLHSGGSGVSDSIVRAIQAISVGSTFDVVAQVLDDPSDTVDATKFVAKVRAMDEGDAARGCARARAKDTDGDGVKDTFVGVDVGTRACFEVIPAINTIVKPTKVDQYFLAVLQILGLPGPVRLDTQTIRFRVPKI